MPASTMLLLMVLLLGLIIHTLVSPENARPKVVLSRLQATLISQLTIAVLYRLLLFNNQFLSVLMLRLGNSIKPVSSQTAELNLTTAS